MPRGIVWLALVALLCFACGENTKETNQSRPDNNLAEKLAPAAAGQLVRGLSKNLGTALMAAFNEGGAADAITVCAEKAPIIAATFSEHGVSEIKRVTDRPRNPGNAADSAELAVLAKFSQMAEPAPFGEWDNETTKSRYQYYQPIQLKKLCLNCHGPTDQLDAEVAQTLAATYPDDLAVGYQDGDLRGMFVVTLQWPQATDLVIELAGNLDKPVR